MSNNIPNWVVWAIFGIVIVTLIHSVFFSKKDDKISFALPKFNFKKNTEKAE